MQMSEMRVVTPRTLTEALELLQAHKENARPLAGATDAMVRVKEGHWRVPLWVNIRSLPELLAVTEEAGRIVVGAAVPFGKLMRNPLLQQHAPLLLEGAGEVGSVQIRAAGTLGGNLGTASPAGDTIPALVALEAEVQLRSTQGERWVPIEQFLLGPGKTARRPDELIAAVRFAPQPEGELSRFSKLGLRGAQAISIVSVAMRLRLGEEPGTVSFARFAFGAAAPTVVRGRQCEAMICHAGTLTMEKLRGIGQMAWKEVAPISDIRASAEYRQQMAAALLQRGLFELLLGGGAIHE